MSSAPLAGRKAAFYSCAVMTGSGKSGVSPRSERLRAALRENLKRRKAQERARKARETPDSRANSASPPRAGRDR